jgi:Ulp1 family protease
MKCLRPKTWLNDEVIDYFFRIYLAHVDKRLCDDNSIPKRSYIFPPQFMLRLLDETNEDERLRDVYNYKQVMRWTKGVDIFTQRRLIFPINKTGSHWMLACVLFDSKEIRYYDSMCPSDTPLTKWIKKRLFGIAQYIEDEYQRKLESAFDWSRWKIVHCNTPQQENGEFLFVSFHVICVYVYTHIQFIILTPFYHAS